MQVATISVLTRLPEIHGEQLIEGSQPRETCRIHAQRALPARSPVSPFDQRQPFRAENSISRHTGIVRRGNPTECAYYGPGAKDGAGAENMIHR